MKCGQSMTPKCDAVFTGIEPDNRDGRIMAALRLARQLESSLAEAVAALRAMVIMSDRGPQPKKLDEAMSWRDNDILARKMADAVLAKHSGVGSEGKIRP